MYFTERPQVAVANVFSVLSPSELLPASGPVDRSFCPRRFRPCNGQRRSTHRSGLSNPWTCQRLAETGHRWRRNPSIRDGGSTSRHKGIRSRWASSVEISTRPQSCVQPQQLCNGSNRAESAVFHQGSARNCQERELFCRIVVVVVVVAACLISRDCSRAKPAAAGAENVAGSNCSVNDRQCRPNSLAYRFDGSR